MLPQLPQARVADVIGRTAPLGTLRKQLGPFFLTAELRLPLSSVPYDEIIRRLHDHLKVENEVRVDGLKVQAAEGFVLARQSVMEPVVKMRLEGHAENSLHKLLEKCSRAVPEFSGEISAQVGSAKSS